MVWCIADWAKIYEKAQSRAVKQWSWVAIPNKHDSDGYTRLLDHDHGVMHYGAWCLLVQVASKCEPRGVLWSTNRVPHTCESIGRITRVNPSVFREAIPRFIEIGWLEEVPKSTLIARYERAISHITGHNRTEQDITEQEDCSEPLRAAAEPAILDFPVVGKKDGNLWSLTAHKVQELSAAFPGLDVLAESRKALAWCNANPSRRKTVRGMAAFLYRWMERAQNGSRGGSPRQDAPGFGSAWEEAMKAARNIPEVPP